MTAQKTMKAVVVQKPGVMALEQIPMPAMGDYDCLARIKYCGFCNGTDIQIYQGTLSHSGDDHIVYPAVLGHEASCEVVAVGGKVRNIAAGDRFIRPILPDSPYTIAFGNMAEYGIVRDYRAMLQDGLLAGDTLPYIDNCCAIPRDVSFEDGAALVTLCECLSALQHFDIVKPGASILIYGAGPVGLSLMQFAFALGAGSVTVVDGVPDRLRLAQKYGATRTIDFTGQDVRESIGEHLVDAAIDAVGATKILMDASWLVKTGGKVCSYGVLRSDDFHIDFRKVNNNISIHKHNFQFMRFQFIDQAVQLIGQKKIDPTSCYSHIMPVEDVEECLKLTAAKQVLKVLLGF